MDRKQIEVAGLHRPQTARFLYYRSNPPSAAETGRAMAISTSNIDRQLPRHDDRSQAKPVFATSSTCRHRPRCGMPRSTTAFHSSRHSALHGLRVPGTHVTYPDIWVNRLRQLNGGRENQVVALSNILASSAPKSAAAKSAAPRSVGIRHQQLLGQSQSVRKPESRPFRQARRCSPDKPHD
jgi:hypothetical protein